MAFTTIPILKRRAVSQLIMGVNKRLFAYKIGSTALTYYYKNTKQKNTRLINAPPKNRHDIPFKRTLLKNIDKKSQIHSDLKGMEIN